jgi:ComF family protein
MLVCMRWPPIDFAVPPLGKRLRSGLRSKLAPDCAVCGLAPGNPVCNACEQDFFSRTDTRCGRCALPLANPASSICGRCLAHPPHFDGTLALADYRAPVDGMVVALKFSARRSVAVTFGQLLARRETEPDLASALVTAVPLAFERESERGFNQSIEIARVYARACGLPSPTRVLLRVRHTPPQQTLALEARRHNVRGAFAVAESVADRTVIVVDDVMTSGSTLDEIANTLKKAGAARVLNRVAARTP